MALEPAPIQERLTDDMGILSRIWIFWFTSVSEESTSGWSGTFTNGDGDTVTVVNGKITDVS